jgi:hypothetical protein
MPNLTDLTPAGAPRPEPELHEAMILDDATAADQEVRCTRTSLDPLLADDPMQWTPYVTGDGVYYPKRGDRAVIGFPEEGAAVILQWWPSAAEPDVPFPT